MWKELLANSMPWEGKLVRLRFITSSDAPLHLRLSNEADVRRFLGPSLDQTEAKAEAFLKKMNPTTNSLYVIESVASGLSLGYCGFMPNRDIPETDMLISLLPEHQGNGYGSEVLDMLQSAWLDRLGNNGCFATVWPENTRAVALLNSHGFTHVREYVDFFDQVHHVYKSSRVTAVI